MVMRRERLLLSLKRELSEAYTSPFLLFVRAKDFEIVGIMTKILHKYDSGWGAMRVWAIGLTLDGKKFEEPLDRKNRRTGELEDLIQMKTNLLVITARNSSDPDDDDDKNFQYLIGPNQANSAKDAVDRIHERDRIIHDLQKKLDETENQRDFYQREAEASGSEIRNLKTRLSVTSEQLAYSEEQAKHYRTELKKAHVGRLEQEGELDEKLKGARDRGGFGAKDSADVIVTAAEKQKDARKHMADLGLGEISPEYATKADMRNMERRLTDTISKLTTPPEHITPEPERPAKTEDEVPSATGKKM
jgi:hypothetical protein